VTCGDNPALFLVVPRFAGPFLAAYFVSVAVTLVKYPLREVSDEKT
jgi:hypothetical protein